MTRKEAIDIIKCLAWHTRPDEEDVEQAIEALEQTSPCDLCLYNPPSSGDSKPCSMCPACSGGDEE